MTTDTTTKQRPILFSGAMVNAILSGRKTQTRRVVEVAPFEPTDDNLDRMFYTGLLRCPYGQPGDGLWVRESLKEGDDGEWCYAADGEPLGFDCDDETAAIAWVYNKQATHCPSIHMPGWASRITLRITGVKVERLNEITEADAQAEGADREFRTVVMSPDGVKDYHMPTSYRAGFANLWDSINAKRGYSWDSNPWVWVVGFERIKE